MGDHLGVLSAMLAGFEFDNFYEKVSNLSIFVMHLSTMESEFETLVMEKDHMVLFGKSLAKNRVFLLLFSEKCLFCELSVVRLSSNFLLFVNQDPMIRLKPTRS